jgi:hypothetical protein
MRSNLSWIKATFDDVFGTGLNPTEYKGPVYSGSQTKPTQTNVHVHHCVFRGCADTSNGGALSCGSAVYRLLIEQTSFISCQSSGQCGGAIYFESSANGQCVLNKVCGFNCFSTYTSGSSSNWGQLAYTSTKNDISYKNDVNDSSITHSTKKGAYPYYQFRLGNGKILCPSINLTHNECCRYPALYTSPVSGTETVRISYSSIVNNTANGGYSCFLLQNSGSSQLIDTCNILNNKQTTSFDLGTFNSNTNLIIKNSCILGNNNGYIVFKASSSTITISNCTLDDDIRSGRTAGSVIITKTNEKGFINALSHIATQECDSYFDSYGTLSVKQSIKSPHCLLSCNNVRPMFNQLRNLQFMFLLTFLPSNPSSNFYLDTNCIFVH